MAQKNDPQETDKNQQRATFAQQKKQDALDLAELIYDIFQDRLSSATMEVKYGKDNKND